MIVDGSIEAEETLTLKPDGPERPHAIEPGQTDKTIDRLVMGRQEINFSDLAAWLAEMGRFADKLATYDAPREAAPF